MGCLISIPRCAIRVGGLVGRLAVLNLAVLVLGGCLADAPVTRGRQSPGGEVEAFPLGCTPLVGAPNQTADTRLLSVFAISEGLHAVTGVDAYEVGSPPLSKSSLRLRMHGVWSGELRVRESCRQVAAKVYVGVDTEVEVRAYVSPESELVVIACGGGGSEAEALDLLDRSAEWGVFWIGVPSTLGKPVRSCNLSYSWRLGSGPFQKQLVPMQRGGWVVRARFDEWCDTFSGTVEISYEDGTSGSSDVVALLLFVEN